MNVFSMFLILLLTLYFSTLCVAEETQVIKQSPFTDGEDFTFAPVLSAGEPTRGKKKVKSFLLTSELKPPRIAYYSGDIDKTDRRCPKDKSDTSKKITTIKDEEVICSERSSVSEENDLVLEVRPRSHLRTHTMNIHAFLSRFLRVLSLKTTTTVFDFSNEPVCKHFNFQYGRSSNGNKTFDMMIYFAANQVSEKEKDAAAYAQFCSSKKEEPIVMVLNFNPDKALSNTHSEIMGMLMKMFQLEWCSERNRKAIVYRSNKGTDFALNKCLKYDCELKNANKIVEFKKKDETAWTPCTDDKGMPLKNLDDAFTCPSWFHVCSEPYKDEIVQNISYTETPTISLIELPSHLTSNNDEEKLEEDLKKNNISLQNTGKSTNREKNETKSKDNTVSFVYISFNIFLALIFGIIIF